MRDHIGITCGNSSFDFLSYALVTSKAWNLISGKKIVVGLVSDFASNTGLLDFLSENIDVRPITPLAGIHPAVQAKFSRLWLAQMEEFSENIITIADLDMIPLSNSRNLLLEKCLDNQFIKWGFDHAAYLHPDNYGKWPMDGSTASGKSFQEIVNPNRISIEELVEDWSALPNLGRGNPFNEPANAVSNRSVSDPLPSQLDSSTFLTASISDWVTFGSNTFIIDSPNLRVLACTRILMSSCVKQL